ncbi:MAG: hypothetical protein IPN61_01135 [Bacteroidetes bacterium]|nr:hypothetical protein [Bacteroidota bacterium]
MIHVLQNQCTSRVNNSLKYFLLLVMAFICSTSSFSQTTVSYTGMGSVTCPATPTSTAAPAVSGLTFASLSRGPGVGCSSASTGISGNAFNVTGSAAAVTGNKYYTFSITANATTNFTLSKVTIVSQVSANTITGEVQYRIDAGALTSLGTFTPTGTSLSYVFTPGSPISVSAGQVLNIYVYGYNALASGTTFRVNNNTSVEVTASSVTPTLTRSPATLTFANQAVSTTSASQNFLLSGANLSPAASDITVTAPSTDYVVSYDDITFGPTALVPYTAGTFTNVPVYVRFAPQSAGLKTGDVTFSGGSVSTPPVVGLSGTGYIPATQLAITNISPASPIQNASFSVTVESQDATNVARNVQTATNVSLTLLSGSGTLTGTLTGTIGAGSSSTVISGVLYDVAESGVSLTATRTSGDVLTAGNSATFTVAAPSSAVINVNSTITAFSTVSGTPSASQNYTVSGSNLVDDITLVPSAQYEISLDNTNWTTSSGSIVLPESAGSVATTTIHVRFNPTAPGTLAGTVSHTSNTANPQTLSLSGTAIASEPTVQSAITFGTVTATSMVLNFAGGDGLNRVVIAHTSPVVFSPIDGTTLSGVNSDYNLATDQGSGNKAVYDGSGNTVTVTGLAAATTYHYAVYEYNGSGALTNYYVVSPGTNSTSTFATEPASSATTTITKVKTSEMTINFSGGSGPNRLVVVSAVNPVTFIPADGSTYSGVNSDFSVAADQGSGNKIVYSGASVASVLVTGLSVNTLYSVRVYEFNGTLLTTNYLTSTFGSASATTPDDISYTTGTYSQDFNGLPLSGTPVMTGFGQGPYNVSTTPINATSLTGWQIANQASGDARMQADNGAGSTGSSYSYGTTASAERALGSLGATVVPAMGAVFVNTGSTPLSTVTITYVGEQWRYGAGTNTLTFEYSLDGTNILTGTYTGVSALDLTAPVTSGTLGALDGNNPLNQVSKSYTFPLAGNWLPGQKLVIRWKDVNDSGSDDGLAIDDFTFSAVGPQTPLVQDDNISFFSTLTNATGVTWNLGDGANRIVVMNTTNSFTNPVDGSTYTANTVYGGGEQVVYDGPSNIVSITNLTPSTQYFFRVYSYNGAGVATKYNTSTATLNPNDVTTAAPSFPTQLVVLNVNGGADVVVNQPFSITIQAQDNVGSPQNVTQNTTIDLTVFAGFGSLLSGTTTGVMLSGTDQITISGIVYDVAEPNVIINAATTAGDVLFDAQTPAFEVYDIANQLQFASTPPNGVVNVAVDQFYVFALRPNASIDPYYVGSATIAIFNGPGSISGTLTVPFVNGIATFSNVVFSQVGTYVLEATSGSLFSTFSSNILINPPVAFTELVVPQFMGSKTTSTTNTNRTPIAVCFQIDNLIPNTSYNVAAGIGLTSEASTSLGAGTIWNGTAYSGQTRNSAFTTDANGASGPVWIFLQPSGNVSRFDGGAVHNVRIAYSTGTFGTIVPNFITTKTITALDIAPSALTPATTDDGALLTGELAACIGGKYILIYDNTAGTGDPIFAYPANSSGLTQGTQTGFPGTLVDQIFMGSTAAGTFAAVYPIGANNSNGVRRIEARNADNTIAAFETSATGIWAAGANTTTAIRRQVVSLSNADASLSSVTVSASSTNVLCFGGATGTATATATSTNTPIDYLWAPNGEITNAISGLIAGTYSVTATDGIGCTASSSVVVTQPNDILIVGQVTNTGCSGGGTGAVDITVAGGTSPYTFLWSNSATTEDITGLGAGTYTVTVTDANGCTKSESFTVITQSSSTISVTATPAAICAGESSVLEATGASTYTWTPSGSLSSPTGSIVTATPSATTSYTVTAVDISGCTTLGTVTLTVNDLPIVGVTPVTTTMCEGSSVSLTATGASTYSWTPGTGLDVTTGSVVIASPIVTTVYTVTGTSVEGCTASSTTTVNIINVSAPTVSSPVTYCQNDIATPLTATTLPGYSAWWYTTPTGGTPNASITPSTATAGSTTYYVSQQQTAPLSIAITGFQDPAPDEYSFVALSRIPAGTIIYFTDNGWTGTGFRSASAVDANGSEGFVRWTALNTVAAGTMIKSTVSTADYIWTTTGPITCSACTTAQNYTQLDFAGAGDQIYAFTSTVTDNPLFNTAQQIHLAVFDDTNIFENATSTATGNVPPGLTSGVEANTFPFASANYVNLNFSAQSRTISGWRTFIAASANYTTGTGVNPGLPSTPLNVDLGCESPRTPITVIVNEAPVVTATADPILCNGGTTVVTVSATGGVTPYTGTGTFTVSAGTHNYTVAGADGCSGIASITLTEPTAVVVTAVETTPVLCNGGTATVTVTATGGTGILTGEGTFTVSAGTHTYIVTDANGCTGTNSITITEPTAISVTVTETTPIVCPGGTATVTVSASGGTGVLSGTGTFTVAAGTYNYTVTDENGCTGTGSITVSDPAAVLVSNFTPTSGCVGSTVSIFGSNLNLVTAIDLNGISTIFVIVNSGEITVTIPPAATSGSFNLYTAANCTTTTANFTVTTCPTGMTLNLTAFLQGFYLGGGTMQPALLNQLVPGATGAEADTITVEIYDASTFLIAASTQAVLMTDGTCSATLNAADGNYYIAIRHRNSLLTWSAVDIAMASATPASYDFSTSATQAFSGWMADDLNEGIYSIFTGDINQDEFVDAADFPPYDNDNTAGLCCDYYVTDLNGDGFVDAGDFPAYDNNNAAGVFAIHP